MTKMIIVILFLSYNQYVFGQIDKGLTTIQIEDMQKSAINIVDNYLSQISLIATLSADNQNVNAVKEFRIDALKYFENSSVQVYNDLIEGGSDYMEIGRYLTTISSKFAKFSGNIESSKPAPSTAYIDNSGYYIVKVSVVVNISGLDNDKQPVAEKNQLDFYLKYLIVDKSYNSPLIYYIMPSSNEKGKLTPVNIVSISTFSSNKDDLVKLQNQLKESEFKKKQIEDEVKRLKAEYEKKYSELSNREDDIKTKEKEIAASKQLINEQLMQIQKKQDEIDEQKRQINKQKEHIEGQSIVLNKKDQKLKEYEKKLLNVKEDIEIDKGNQYNFRRVLHIGVGMNNNAGTLQNNINSGFNEDVDLSMQIHGLIGYRFDFRHNDKLKSKINRGHILGAFINYSFNSEKSILSTITNQNLSIIPERQSSIYNRSLEMEFGLILNEMIRMSGGVGGINGYRYNIATASFNIPIVKSFSIEIGSSFLFGQDFRKVQLRPYSNLAFHFNDKKPRRIINFNKKGKVIIQIADKISYNVIPLDSGLLIKTSSNNILSFFAGIRIFQNMSIGVFGDYGNYSKNFSNNISNSMLVNIDSINNNYNPMYNFNLAVYNPKNFYFTFGVGNLLLDNQKIINFTNVSIGKSFVFKNNIFFLNVEISDKFINRSVNNNLFSFSAGMGLRFDLIK